MSEPVTIAYVARHGATVLNDEGKFRGMANPPLNANGRADAHKLAFYFEPIDLSAIFYSDKLRSEETAGIVAHKKPAVPCFPCPNLWPWNVGKFSGQPKDKKNCDELEYYVQNPDVSIPKGGSLNEFKSRIQPCVMEAMEIANKAGKPVLLVVHSSVVHEVGSLINSDHGSTLVDPGGVAVVFSQDGRLHASPVFKPYTHKEESRAETIT